MTPWLTPLARLVATSDPAVRRELTLMHEWSLTVLVSVATLAVVILALTAWNVRRLRPRRRAALLVGLRALVLLLLTGLLLEPAIREEEVMRQQSDIVVLVDTSRSMGLTHGDQRRIDLVWSFLFDNDEYWETLSRRHNLHFFSFADELAAFDPREARDPSEERALLAPRGDRTDFHEALTAVEELTRGRAPAAVLLLSDGIDTSDRDPPLMDEAGPTEETTLLLQRLGAPLFTFGLDESAGLKDISIEALRVADFAFLMNLFRIQVDLGIRGDFGPDPPEIVVTLLANGVEKDRRHVPAIHRDGIVELAFETIPRELGETVYTVVAKPLPGEASTDNNSASAVVRVLRDRIRVLQIAGRPSWDVRFLRNLLKRNPNIDLVSFFILVNPAGTVHLSSAETSLIPFPAHELFVEELGGFDLVILQDFSHGPFQTRQHLHLIRDYVRSGGALLMLGGRQAFSAGGYYRTALTDILPVRLPPDRSAGDTISSESFKPVLTEAGRRHPILNHGIGGGIGRAIGGGETATLPASLPPLDGINLFDGTTERGLALLAHPRQRYRGEARPVVAVGEAGEGRTMVFGSNSSWRWGFAPADSEATPGEGTRHFYDRFWNNSIRWLLRDPSLDLVQVTAHAKRLRLGESIEATVTLRESDYRPAGETPFRARVWRRSGGADNDMERVAHDTGEEVAGADGTATIEFTPENPGIYEIVAEAQLDGMRREGRALVSVEHRDPEMEKILPTRRTLARLAEATGGHFAPLADPGPPPDLQPKESLDVLQRTHHDLWSSGWMLALAAALFGADWWLRRRFGEL